MKKFTEKENTSRHPANKPPEKQEDSIPQPDQDIVSAICETTGLSQEEAKRCLAALSENQIFVVGTDEPDSDRMVYLNGAGAHTTAVSRKPFNMVFHFRRAALDASIDAVELHQLFQSGINNRVQILYMLLLLLKFLSRLEVALTEKDAQLLQFLWTERVHRRLVAESEYDAFIKQLKQQGKSAVTELEYHQALNRLADLRTIRIENGEISLCEKVVIS